MTTPTFITVILDETGSMSGQEQNVIDSTNEYITGHREIPDCYFNLLKFDAFANYGRSFGGLNNQLNENIKNEEPSVRMMFEKRDIKDVPLLSQEDYNPRGMTNLYDAVGTAVSQLELQTSNFKESNVILVVNTDGMENASREYTAESIRTKLKDKQDNHNWKVIFLGADLTTEQSNTLAGSIGIKSDSTYTYSKSATRSVHSDLTAASSLYASTMSAGNVEDADEAFNNMNKYK